MSDLRSRLPYSGFLSTYITHILIPWLISAVHAFTVVGGLGAPRRNWLSERFDLKMATFFGITKHPSKLARRLSVDYSFDDVEDPMIVNYAQAPPEILKKFSYAIRGYIMEDMLANGVGGIFSRRCWFVCSANVRIVEILIS